MRGAPVLLYLFFLESSSFAYQAQRQRAQVGRTGRQVSKYARPASLIRPWTTPTVGVPGGCVCSIAAALPRCKYATKIHFRYALCGDDRDADVCPSSDMLYPPAFEILANPPTEEPRTLPLVRHMVRHGILAIGDTLPVMNAREMREQRGRLDNFGVCKHDGRQSCQQHACSAASPSLSDSQPKHVTRGPESSACCVLRAACRVLLHAACCVLRCAALHCVFFMQSSVLHCKCSLPCRGLSSQWM